MNIVDDQTKALFRAGLVKPIDLLPLLALLADGLVSFFAWLFSPAYSKYNLLEGLLVAVIVVGLWAVLLGYRTCLQCIKARADINLMPETAARLAMLYQRKGVATDDLKP